MTVNIHAKLKEVMEEYDKFMIDAHFPIVELKNPNEYESSSFNSTCVILVDSEIHSNELNQLRYQTFKITSSTTFKNILNGCFNIWDLHERSRDFELKFLDAEALVKIEVQDVVDVFLKSKSNVFKAKFVLHNRKISIYFLTTFRV
jgi:hypothetical protein